MGNIYSDARVWRVKALMRTMGWTPQKRKSIVLTVRFDNENNDSKENNKFFRALYLSLMNKWLKISRSGRRVIF